MTVLLFLFAATVVALAAAPVARKFLTPAGFRRATSRSPFAVGVGAAAGVPPTPTGDTGSRNKKAQR